MSAILHTISSRRLRAFVAVAALLSTAFLAATATQVAAAGEPPCPSCPDRMPPTGGGGSAGQGNAGQGSSGAPAQAVQPVSYTHLTLPTTPYV